MADTKIEGQLWLQCMTCKYRWPVCPIPVAVKDLNRVGKGAMCPGCGEKKQIGVLPTDDKDGKQIPYQLGREGGK